MKPCSFESEVGDSAYISSEFMMKLCFNILVYYNFVRISETDNIAKIIVNSQPDMFNID